MKNEVVVRYLAGESAPKIAADLGVTTNSIYRELKRRGVQRRTSGGGKKAPLDIVLIRSLYEGGETVSSLARRFSIGFGAMQRRLVESGAVMRPNNWDHYTSIADEIVRLYVEEGLSSSLIASRLKLHRDSVLRYLRNRGVEIRPDCAISVFSHNSPCAGDVLLKGTWERAYARVLDAWYSAGNILGWSYESDRIDTSAYGAGRYYLPDFRVQHRSAVVYHEVKGYWREKSKAKVEAARALGHRIIVIRGRYLQSLCDAIGIEVNTKGAS